MSDKNLYDFADVSDLPQKLREALETSTTDNARKYAAIVTGAPAAFPSLNIRQVEAVANRMFGEVPTTTTVRAYLNAAVKLGLIGKPSRNSYGKDASVVVEGDDETDDAKTAAPAPSTEAAPAAAAVAETDPLAGL